MLTKAAKPVNGTDLWVVGQFPITRLTGSYRLTRLRRDEN
jgi:hypothetical protein